MQAGSPCRADGRPSSGPRLAAVLAFPYGLSGRKRPIPAQPARYSIWSCSSRACHAIRVTASAMNSLPHPLTPPALRVTAQAGCFRWRLPGIAFQTVMPAFRGPGLSSWSPSASTCPSTSVRRRGDLGAQVEPAHQPWPPRMVLRPAAARPGSSSGCSHEQLEVPAQPARPASAMRRRYPRSLLGPRTRLATSAAGPRRFEQTRSFSCCDRASSWATSSSSFSGATKPCAFDR